MSWLDRLGYKTSVFVSDQTLQAVERDDDIQFCLTEENRLSEFIELSEESLEYNRLNRRRHMGN